MKATGACRLLVSLLCALWGVAVIAAVDGPPAVRRAGEGVGDGLTAIAWQDGVAKNATELLTALEEASTNITEAEGEAEQIGTAAKDKLKKVVKDLESKINTAKAEAQNVKDMEGKVLKNKEDNIRALHTKLEAVTAEIQKLRTEGGSEKDVAGRVAALKTPAEEAASLWGSLLGKFSSQLTAAYSASNATDKAEKDVVEAEQQFETTGTSESDEHVKSAKEKLTKAKGCLLVSSQKASSMVKAAETVNEFANKAEKAFKEAAKLAGLEKDTKGTTGKTEETQNKEEKNTGTSTTGVSGDKNDRDASNGSHITAWAYALVKIFLAVLVFGAVC